MQPERPDPRRTTAWTRPDGRVNLMLTHGCWIRVRTSANTSNARSAADETLQCLRKSAGHLKGGTSADFASPARETVHTKMPSRTVEPLCCIASMQHARSPDTRGFSSLSLSNTKMPSRTSRKVENPQILAASRFPFKTGGNAAAPQCQRTLRGFERPRCGSRVHPGPHAQTHPATHSVRSLSSHIHNDYTQTGHKEGQCAPGRAPGRSHAPQEHRPLSTRCERACRRMRTCCHIPAHYTPPCSTGPRGYSLSQTLHTDLPASSSASRTGH